MHRGNDHGKYDAPALTVRRSRNDLEGLHYALHRHMNELSEAQRELIVDTSFEEESRHEIVARRGITVNTYDNLRKAAYSKLRESMMAVLDRSTDIDLPHWYDRAEERNKRHAAR